MVKVSRIPPEGLTSDVTTAAVTLSGHQKKIGLLRWSLVVNHLLGSCSFDNSIKLWDIEKGTQVQQFADFPEQIFSFEFSQDSSQLAAFCRDKQLRFFDARAPSAVTVTKGSDGAKQARGCYLPDKRTFLGVGFNRQASRQLSIWDPRNPAMPTFSLELDQASGVLIPFYDSDNGVCSLLVLEEK